MQRAMASGQRIAEVLDVPVDVKDRPGAVALPADFDGSVEFSNVTFGYRKGLPVLKNVSFRVNPGETVALVGPTGSGKSSAMALAHRFYDVWDGQVLVGGHGIRDLTQEFIGRRMAMVLQEPFLFSGTVFENIRYNKHDASRDDVVRAAQAVGAHDFIMRLPGGYDSMLEQRGGNLSIGQRQLISFARALVADAKILVLDEATASIDSYTRVRTRRPWCACSKAIPASSSPIAWRPSATPTASSCCRTARSSNPGTHDELMALGGLYARLYNMNYASFDDIPDELIASLTPAGAT